MWSDLAPTWSQVGPTWAAILNEWNLYAPFVRIDGTDYTGEALNGLNITRGRDTVYQAPTAGYARVQLVDIAGLGLPIDIATNLTIGVTDPEANELTLFSGYVTDISADLYDPGIGQRPGAIYSILAVGPLARLSRRIVLDDGRPAETDGDRIAAAVQAGLSATFDETGGTWADIDPTLTWHTFDDGYDPALIDPGVFDLVALPGFDSGYTALEVAEQASASGEGLLYETLDGLVGWDNANARGSMTDPIVIPGDVINAGGLRTASSVSDLVNRATVQYPGGAETAQDLTAVQTFTLYERIINTQLASSTAAGDRAAAYVERHAYPVINLDAIVIRLDTLEDTALRGALLQVRSGSYVRLVDLPPTLGVTYLDAFVEGTSMRLERQRAELRLNVSDASLSYSQVRWSGVDPALEWGDVDGMLEWQNARSL
jgi:hypothetical protein